jgi:hypothetical protein
VFIINLLLAQVIDSAVHIHLWARFLSTESEQLIWKSEGLPSDDLSMENAMVILQVDECLALHTFSMDHQYS